MRPIRTTFSNKPVFDVPRARTNEVTSMASMRMRSTRVARTRAVMILTVRPWFRPGNHDAGEACVWGCPVRPGCHASWELKTASAWCTIRLVNARTQGREFPISRPALIGRYTYRPKTDEWWWSDNMFRIHGFDPGAVVPTTSLVMRHIHAEDVDRAWESREATVE